LAPLLAGFDAPERWPVTNFPSTGAEYLGNVLYFLPFLGNSRARLVPVVWTLVLEVQLYLFFSACLYLGHKLGILLRVESHRTTLLVLLAATLLGSLWPLGVLPYVDHWLWPHLNNFMLGVAACSLACRLPGRYLLLSCAVVPHLIGVVLTRDSYLAAGLGAFVGLAIPNSIRLLDSLLTSRPLLAAGRWSYAIYLLHPIVGALTVEALKDTLGGPPLVNLVYVVLGIVTTCLASAAVWRYVEQPSIRFSKRFKLGGEGPGIRSRQPASAAGKLTNMP
jgi:peptidoglycan/LPS O-acetylase OafA/YrhL